MDAEEWYYQSKDEKTMGPVSKRDIDVEWRTNNITSDTLVFKQEFGGWKKLREVSELVQLLNIANAEVNEEVLKARKQLTHISNPLIAASKVGKYAPYQTEDGLWHYYDPKVKKWKTTKDDPHKHPEHKKSEDLLQAAGKKDGEEISNEELAKLEEEQVLVCDNRIEKE